MTVTVFQSDNKGARCSRKVLHARIGTHFGEGHRLKSIEVKALGSPHLEPRPFLLNDPAEMTDVVDVRFAGWDRRRLRETFFGRPTRATRCSEE